MAETRSIVAGGFKTSYLEAGDPGNPTVVLIHDGAFGTTADLCWGEVADVLSDRFHVLAPDMLGWGGTDKVAFFDRAPYPPRIEHIKAWLGELSVDDAFFAGSSFGGSLVMRALIDPNSPWPIRRAVSIGGAGGLFRYPEGVQALSDYEPSLEAARSLTLLVVDDDYPGLDDHAAQRYENSLVPGHWESLSAPRLKNPATTRPPFDDPFPGALGNVQQPLLLIEGSRDKLLEPGWAAHLAKLAPRGESVVLESGHEPNIDQPELCAETLAGFFTKEDE